MKARWRQVRADPVRGSGGEGRVLHLCPLLGVRSRSAAMDMAEQGGLINRNLVQRPPTRSEGEKVVGIWLICVHEIFNLYRAFIQVFSSSDYYLFKSEQKFVYCCKYIGAISSYVSNLFLVIFLISLSG